MSLVRERLGSRGRGSGDSVVCGEFALDLGVGNEESGPGVVEGVGEGREEGGGWEEGGGFEAGGTGLWWWGRGLRRLMVRIAPFWRHGCSSCGRLRW